MSEVKIVVEDYSPDWKKSFEELSQAIWPKVADCAISIEHVGSTSVVGLAAKPIIDIDIIVNDFSKIENIVSALSELDYIHLGNLGVEGREAFRHEYPKISHHLYVCEKDCMALRNHLILRDHLRSNKDDCQQYSSLKKELALKHSKDIDSYIEGKSDFINSILAKYPEKFTKKELDQIIKINKK